MRKAFTLIELLIVVAIIAILAAIAVPNFIEAQTRAKVSRAKSDMRSMDTALMSYVVDNNVFPACHRFGIMTRDALTEPEVLERLSTPISYVSNVIARDAFRVGGRLSAGTAQGQMDQAANGTFTVLTAGGTDLVANQNSYIYQAFAPEGRSQTTTDSFAPVAFQPNASAFVLHSVGPDGLYSNLGGILANEDDAFVGVGGSGPIGLMYDPTNGTTSFGCIWRANGDSDRGSTSYAGGKGLLDAIRLTNK